MNAFAHHFAYEFKAGLRNPTLMLMNYLFPLAFYAMMGLIMTQINPMFKDSIIPAIIAFVAMVTTLLGLPGPMVEAREAGIYRSFKINGIPALSVLAIPALTTIFHTLIAAVIIAVSAGPLFGGLNPSSWLGLAGVAVLGAFSMGALGALIGVVSGSARATVLLAQAVFLPSMLIGGLMVPLEMLPEGIRFVSAMLPATHLMQAFLALAYNQETIIPLHVSVSVLLAAGVFSSVLALYLFNWDTRNSSHRGHPLLALLALLPYLVGALLVL
jgi:ABC-2 type transport system permease protein